MENPIIQTSTVNARSIQTCNTQVNFLQFNGEDHLSWDYDVEWWGKKGLGVQIRDKVTDLIGNLFSRNKTLWG